MCAVAGRAQTLTNVIYGSVGDYGLNPQQQVTITLTLQSPNPRTVNNILVRQDPVSQTSDMNGNFSFTNIQWGKYLVGVAGAIGTQYTAYVGTNSTGSVALASLITNAQAVPPNNGTNYYTQSQVNALIPSVAAGANVTVSQSGSVYTVSSTGGGGSATNASLVNGVAGAVSIGGPGLQTNGTGNYTVIGQTPLNQNVNAAGFSLTNGFVQDATSLPFIAGQTGFLQTGDSIQTWTNTPVNGYNPAGTGPITNWAQTFLNQPNYSFGWSNNTAIPGYYGYAVLTNLSNMVTRYLTNGTTNLVDIGVMVNDANHGSNAVGMLAVVTNINAQIRASNSLTHIWWHTIVWSSGDSPSVIFQKSQYNAGLRALSKSTTGPSGWDGLHDDAARLPSVTTGTNFYILSGGSYLHPNSAANVSLLGPQDVEDFLRGESQRQKDNNSSPFSGTLYAPSWASVGTPDTTFTLSIGQSFGLETGDFVAGSAGSALESQLGANSGSTYGFTQVLNGASQGPYYVEPQGGIWALGPFLSNPSWPYLSVATNQYIEYQELSSGTFLETGWQDGHGHWTNGAIDANDLRMNFYNTGGTFSIGGIDYGKVLSVALTGTGGDANMIWGTYIGGTNPIVQYVDHAGTLDHGYIDASFLGLNPNQGVLGVGGSEVISNSLAVLGNITNIALQPSQFVATATGTNLVSTLNGSSLTNIPISALQTNGYGPGTAYVLTNNGTQFVLTNAPSGGGSGTVTSVAVAADSAGVIASVSGSPITTSGTITPTFSGNIQGFNKDIGTNILDFASLVITNATTTNTITFTNGTLTQTNWSGKSNIVQMLGATGIYSQTISNNGTLVYSVDTNGNVVANGATGFTGGGSGLTSLNASALASGTVPTAQLGSGTANAGTVLDGASAWTVMTNLTATLPLSISSGVISIPTLAAEIQSSNTVTSNALVLQIQSSNTVTSNGVIAAVEMTNGNAVTLTNLQSTAFSWQTNGASSAVTNFNLAFGTPGASTGIYQLVSVITNAAFLAVSGGPGAITVTISNQLTAGAGINVYFPTNMAFPTNTITQLFGVSGTNYTFNVGPEQQAVFSFNKRTAGNTWSDIIGNGGVYSQ